MSAVSGGKKNGAPRKEVSKEAVAMSAEASVALPALLASEGCPSLVPIQHHQAGVSFDLKPLSPSSKYVKLNVGGSLHYTTVQTLTKHDTMLKAMFSGRMEVLTDSEGWILIDRSGKHFGTILNYLRDGSVSLPESPRELEEVLCEARYYLIQGLVENCQLAVQQKSEGFDPMCLIPMVTSPKEEQKIIASCAKPVVKLLHNRSNNKYSYTSNSDENLLKNIELFDKLALRFNGRVLFLKDVLGDEICCWSFYGQGRKIAELCCTSIVYATEKKQTKVESFLAAQMTEGGNKSVPQEPGHQVQKYERGEESTLSTDLEDLESAEDWWSSPWRGEGGQRNTAGEASL